MNVRRAKQLFVLSVVFVLSLTAAAKIISAFSSDRILTLQEPVLGMRYRNLLLLGACLECAVVIYLIRGKDALTKYSSITWLGAIFSTYRIAIWWEAPGKLCPCLGTLTGRLPISATTADFLLKVILAYMIIGSTVLLLGEFKLRRKESIAAAVDPGASERQVGPSV